MFRSKDINNEIQGYLTALNQLGIVVHKAILFGSMAKGTPTQYSDIDLAVWSSNFTDNYFTNIEKTACLKRQFINVELHPFTLTDSAANNPFIVEIENTGKVILS